MSAAVSAYLYASYLSRRRTGFLRMREIGLSVRESWKMAAFECVFSVLPTALITLLVSYAMSLLAVLGISKAAGLPFFYRFTAATPGLILLLFLLVTLCALLVAVPVFSGRRVFIKRRGLSRAAVRSLRRRAKRTEKRKNMGVVRETLLRQSKTRPVQTLAPRVLTVFVSVVVLMGVTQISDAYGAYRVLAEAPAMTAYAEGTVQEWTLWVPVYPYEDARGQTRDTRKHSVVAEGFTSGHVVSEASLDRLRQIPGVQGLSCVFRDVTHVLSWQGKETNPVFLSCRAALAKRYGPEDLDLSRPEISALYARVEPLLYSIVCFEDDDAAEAYLSAADPGVYDAAAFCEGRQALMLLDETMGQLSPGNENAPAPDVGLSPGDAVEVQTASGALTLTLAGVCRNTDRVSTGMAALLVSPAFVRLLAEADGRVFGCNTVGLQLDPRADLIGTAGLVTPLLTGEGMRYVNRAEAVENARRAFSRTVFAYGSFALILASLGLLVLNAAAGEERRRGEASAKRLSRLGLESRRYTRGVLLREGKESLFVLPGLPLSVLGAGVLADPASIRQFPFFTAAAAAAALTLTLLVFLCRALGALRPETDEPPKKEV